MPLHPLIATTTVTAIVAICISVLSLLVAIGALTFAIKTFRRAGARLRVDVPGRLRKRWRIALIRPWIWTKAQVTNDGLATVQLTKATWEVKGSGDHSFDAGTNSANDAHGYGTNNDPTSTEAAFPHTLASYYGHQWMTSPPRWDPTETGKTAYRMRLVVTLGSGATVRSRWVIVRIAKTSATRQLWLQRTRRLQT